MKLLLYYIFINPLGDPEQILDFLLYFCWTQCGEDSSTFYTSSPHLFYSRSRAAGGWGGGISEGQGGFLLGTNKSGIPSEPQLR